MTLAQTVEGQRPETPAAAPGSTRRRLPGLAWLGLTPFALYLAAFFLLPTGVVLWEASRTTDADGRTTFTGSNVSATLQGVYLNGLEHSVELSAITAVISAVLGLVLAWAIVNSRSRLLKQAVGGASAVLANFGGLPLAFLFVATLGNSGVVTRVLSSMGISLNGDLHLSLYAQSGVAVVYLYFMVPLMVLVITPALEGLRVQWREAAQNLGATPLQYLRWVAAPVLAPSVGGSVALLFCSSFSAYATAAALTNGTLSLTSLQIKAELSGNVLAGPQTAQIAAALALDMIVVVVPLTLIYQAMQRRTTRWLR